MDDAPRKYMEKSVEDAIRISNNVSDEYSVTIPNEMIVMIATQLYQTRIQLRVAKAQTPNYPDPEEINY